MAKKISELAVAGAVADTDELELNQSGTSSKATRAQIVAGLALASHTHALADLSSFDANGAAITNYLVGQDIETGNYAFVQTDGGREKIFTGSIAATWTAPALSDGTSVVVHNVGTADISFTPSGVAFKGLTTLQADKTASLSWLPGGIVKLTGELT